MSRVEIPHLVEAKILRQQRPRMDGTLMRCECEIGNLLENCLLPLHEDDRAALEDLHRQIKSAIAPDADDGLLEIPAFLRRGSD